MHSITRLCLQTIIDSNGRSGTFNNSTAENITNDLILCEELADKNTNEIVESYKVVHNWYLRPKLYG
jgi:hypothetical protein